MQHKEYILALAGHIDSTGSNIAKLCNDIALYDEPVMHSIMVDAMLDELHKNNTLVTALLAILAAEQHEKE